MIKLRVYGVPVPQGSTRAFAVRKAGVPTGRVTVTGDNPRTRSWRQAILDEVASMYPAGVDVVSGSMIGPVNVRLVFILPRPGSHMGTGKNAARLRPGAPVWPVTKPDLDKLCRAVLDALTDAGVWRDDAQVATLHASKTYAEYTERPGVEIEVTSG